MGEDSNYCELSILVKILIGIVVVVLPIALCEVLGNYLMMNEIRSEVSSVMSDSQLKVKDIDIIHEDLFDLSYTCKIYTSGVDNLSIEELHTLGTKIEEKIDTENWIPSSNIELLLEEDGVYTLSRYSVSKDGQVLYDELEIEKEERNKLLQEEYGDTYPFVTMKEEALEFTKLGKPNRVTPCRDFNHLEPRARSKVYEWGEALQPGYWQVTVWYRFYFASGCDDYIDYGGNDGYVYSIYYHDENGIAHHMDLND